MLNDLAEIISIKSVLDEAEEGAPFGKGCRTALDWFLAKAESFGFSTKNYDGYCGHAEYGEGDECIGVLCHLDVVPAGEGWSSDPFKLVIEDGMLYGRGVADDKGSVVMCLHALKNIKEKAISLKRRIRIIAGCNEEHGSECIKHYVKVGEIPAMSFVPDSDFPIINSEKGILHVMCSVPLDSFMRKNIAYIEGGESYNVVPDRAKVSIFSDSPLGKKIIELCDGNVSDKLFMRPEVVTYLLAQGLRLDDFSIEYGGEVITVYTKGVAGHAMDPKHADNAIWKLFKFLACFDDGEIVSVMNKYICTDMSAEMLGIYKSDEQSGDLTVSMGIISLDNDKLHFSLDMRLPVSASEAEVRKTILSKLPARSKITVSKYAPNLFIDKNSPLVTTLLNAYSSVSGLEPHCLICGGGTYARELPNAIAFGPTFEGRETDLHNVDEHFLVEDFYKAAEIYEKAMVDLANL